METTPAVNQPDLTNLAELEKATNKVYGNGEQSDEQPTEPEEAATPSEPTEKEKTETATPAVKEGEKVESTATPAVAPSQAVPPELKTIFDETPFKGDDIVKSARETVKSYKEIQRSYNDINEVVKPWKQLLDDANRDEKLAQVLRQAEQFYRNPQLAEAMSLQMRGIQRPDQSQYDFNDPRHVDQYNKDVQTYEEQLKMVGAAQEQAKYEEKLHKLENERRQEAVKAEFRQLHPTEDIPELEKWITGEAQKLNPLEVAYKVKNWDKMRESITEEVRKSLNTKIETASKATPKAPSEETQKVKGEEILKHVIRYGPASANKKYGEALVLRAQQELTNRAYAEQ